MGFLQCLGLLAHMGYSLSFSIMSVTCTQDY